MVRTCYQARLSRAFPKEEGFGTETATDAALPDRTYNMLAASASTATYGEETGADTDGDQSVTVSFETFDAFGGATVTRDGISHETRMWCCQVCPFTASMESSLMQHLRIHSNTKSHKCTLCWHAFSKKVHLQDHMRTHTGERPFRCSICSQQFTQKSAMVRHKMCVHKLLKGT